MASRFARIHSWVSGSDSRRHCRTRSPFNADTVSDLSDEDYVRVSHAADRTSENSSTISRSASDSSTATTFQHLKQIMGKSNKFDFTNRSSRGPKLGKSIYQSLEKESAKLQKDSDKQVAKAEKSSRISHGIESGLGDTKEHLIDLQAPNKELTDDGFGFVAVGLNVALNTKSATVSLSLEDLNLSGNNLTAASLAKLAPIIAVAKHSLKTLDLANNDIYVETDAHAAEFETFLRAFRSCLKLRRLDLSGNRLGAKAFEIFAKVYLSEDRAHPCALAGNASVMSIHSTLSDPSLSLPMTEFFEGSENLSQDSLTSFDPMTRARILRRRCGLRSIPYITLQDVGLNDAGALWLSYVVELHYYPIQLTDYLNAPNADTTIRAYAQDANAGGLDYTNNSTITKEGSYMLKKAEAVRAQMLYEDKTDNDSVAIDNIACISTEEDLRRLSLEKHISRAAAGARRASIRSIHTIDGGEHENSELESIRKKVQRHIIENGQRSHVEMWNAAFEVFWIARKLIYIGPKNRRYYVGDAVFRLNKVEKKRAAPYMDPGTCKTHRLTGRSTEAGMEYASQMVIFPDADKDEPGVAITETTNIPTSTRLVKPSTASGVENVTTQLNGMVVRDKSPLRFVKYQERRISNAEMEGKVYRTDTSTALPFEVIDRILFFALSEREHGALSSVQKRAAVEWGSDKATFQEEEKWAKYATSYQVWTLLEKMQGLEYSQ